MTMKIETEIGTVPDTTILPLFTDTGLYPGLISPEKIRFIDGFTTKTTPAAALTGQLVQYSTVGSPAWAVIGSNSMFADPTLDTGSAYPTGTSDRVSVFESGQANVEVFGRIRWETGVAIGLVFRAGASDYLRVVLSGASFSLQSRIGGVTTVLATVAMAPSNGTYYTIKVKADGNNLTAWLNDTLMLSTVSSVLNTNTRVGLFSTGASAGRITEIVVGH